MQSLKSQSECPFPTRSIHTYMFQHTRWVVICFVWFGYLLDHFNFGRPRSCVVNSKSLYNRYENLNHDTLIQFWRVMLLYILFNTPVVQEPVSYYSGHFPTVSTLEASHWLWVLVQPNGHLNMDLIVLFQCSVFLHIIFSTPVVLEPIPDGPRSFIATTDTGV